MNSRCLRGVGKQNGEREGLGELLCHLRTVTFSYISGIVVQSTIGSLLPLLASKSFLLLTDEDNLIRFRLKAPGVLLTVRWQRVCHLDEGGPGLRGQTCVSWAHLLS